MIAFAEIASGIMNKLPFKFIKLQKHMEQHLILIMEIT